MKEKTPGTLPAPDEDTFFLYTVRFEAHDGTPLATYGNQFKREAQRHVEAGIRRSRDIYDPFGPRSEIPIARVVVEMQN